MADLEHQSHAFYQNGTFIGQIESTLTHVGTDSENDYGLDESLPTGQPYVGYLTIAGENYPVYGAEGGPQYAAIPPGAATPTSWPENLDGLTAAELAYCFTRGASITSTGSEIPNVLVENLHELTLRDNAVILLMPELRKFQAHHQQVLHKQADQHWAKAFLDKQWKIPDSGCKK